ncbi:MAG: 16S rRNA (guanine(527)-N(7))-methyltransferase RsmG [Acidobacteriota bacterium]
MQQGNPDPRQVAQAAQDLGRTLDETQAQALATYLGLLEKWNARTNLVGPRTWRAMLEELVADSWHLADLLAGLELPENPVTLDFGAGAGIPGVPLRVFWQAGSYVLIEPRAKRVAFLRQCLAMMRLPRTEVFEGRCEALGREADVCLSRAFQPWREFLGTAARYARGGRLPLVVVFSNEETPEAPIPHGYALAQARAYPSRGRTGYCWVFSPNIS